MRQTWCNTLNARTHCTVQDTYLTFLLTTLNKSLFKNVLMSFRDLRLHSILIKYFYIWRKILTRFKVSSSLPSSFPPLLLFFSFLSLLHFHFKLVSCCLCSLSCESSLFLLSSSQCRVFSFLLSLVFFFLLLPHFTLIISGWCSMRADSVTTLAQEGITPATMCLIFALDSV